MSSGVSRRTVAITIFVLLSAFLLANAVLPRDQDAGGSYSVEIEIAAIDPEGLGDNATVVHYSNLSDREQREFQRAREDWVSSDHPALLEYAMNDIYIEYEGTAYHVDYYVS